MSSGAYYSQRDVSPVGSFHLGSYGSIPSHQIQGQYDGGLYPRASVRDGQFTASLSGASVKDGQFRASSCQDSVKGRYRDSHGSEAVGYIEDEAYLQEQFDKLRELDSRIENLEQAIQEEDESTQSGIIHRVYDDQHPDEDFQASGGSKHSGIIYRVYDQPSEKQYSQTRNKSSRGVDVSHRERDRNRDSLGLSNKTFGEHQEFRLSKSNPDYVVTSEHSNGFHSVDARVTQPTNGYRDIEQFPVSKRTERRGRGGSRNGYKPPDETSVEDYPMDVNELGSSKYVESCTQTSPKKTGYLNNSSNGITDGTPSSVGIHSRGATSKESRKSLDSSSLQRSHRRQSNIGLDSLETNGLSAKSQVPTGKHVTSRHADADTNHSNSRTNKSGTLTSQPRLHHSSAGLNENQAYSQQGYTNLSLPSSAMLQPVKSLEVPDTLYSKMHMLGMGDSLHTKILNDNMLQRQLQQHDNTLSAKQQHMSSFQHPTEAYFNPKSHSSGRDRLTSQKQARTLQLTYSDSLSDFPINQYEHNRVGTPSNLLLSTLESTTLSVSPPLSPSHLMISPPMQRPRSSHRHRRQSMDGFVGQVDLNSSMMTFASFRSLAVDDSMVYDSSPGHMQFDAFNQFGDESFEKHASFRLPHSTNGLSSSYSTHDMSAALWPIKLLELLHCSNHERSQELILKARVFRKWYYQTQLSKRTKDRHDRMEQRATYYNYQNTLYKYWDKWKTKSRNGHKSSNADSMYRHQLLYKGLRGLIWAVEQRQLVIAEVQQMSRGSTLRGYFLEWKIKAEKKRYNLVFKVFRRWQHFKLQSERKRMLTTLSCQHQISKWFSLWKDRHQVQQQAGIAILHYKVGVLTKCWQGWRLYTRQSAVIVQQKQVAQVHYEHVIQRRALLKLKEMYIKYQCAKILWRRNELKRVFQIWQQETAMLKIEHIREIQRSNAIYNTTCLQSAFRMWRIKYNAKCYLQQRRLNICRRAFEIWTLRCRKKVLRRAVEVARWERQTKYRMFITWLQTTRLMREARYNATKLLQRALLRQVVHDWKAFTQYKIQLGVKLQEHVVNTAQQSKKYFFKAWLNQLNKKQCLVKARRLWSLRCVRNAVSCWKEAVRLRQLDILLESHQPRTRYFTVLGAWKTWVHAKHRADWNREKFLGFQRAQEFRQVRLIFYRWRLQAQQSLLAAPLRNKNRRRHLGKAFDAWRLVYLRKRQGAIRYQQYHHNHVKELFTVWRSKASKKCGLVRLQSERQFRVLQNCFHGWREVINRHKLCDLFIERSEKNLVAFALNSWQEKLVATQQIREHTLEYEARIKVLLHTAFNTWQEHIFITRSHDADKVTEFREYRQQQSIAYWFKLWRSRVMLEEKARQLTTIFNHQRLQSLFLAWQTLTTDEICTSIQRFNANLQARSPSHNGEFLNSLSVPASPLPYSARSLRSGPLSARDFSFHPDIFAEFEDQDNDDISHSHHSTPRARILRQELRLSRYSATSQNDSLNSSGNFHAVLTPLTPFGIQGNDLQALATYSISRWRHWPVSATFHQWREFTLRQQIMRLAKACVEERGREMRIRQAFNDWWRSYRNLAIARDHQQISTLRNCLRSWLDFMSQEKKCRAAQQSARVHYLNSVLGRVFSQWKLKIMQKRHLEELHGIWYDLPAELSYLRDLCERFQENITAVTMHNCWAMWRMKYTQMREVDQYRNSKLLMRVFKGWQCVVQRRSESKQISVQFRDHRLQCRVFGLWKRRFHQQQEADRRFVLSWRQYMVDILHSWQTWASSHRLEKGNTQYLSSIQSKSLLAHMFYQWRDQLRKHQLAGEFHLNKTASRALLGWHCAAERQVKDRNLCKQLQDSRNSSLLTTSLHLWRANTRIRQLTRESRQRQLDCYVRNAVTQWRLFTLARRAETHWLYSTQAKVFSLWKAHVEHQHRVKHIALYYGLLWKRNAKNCRRREMEAEDLRRQFNDRVLRVRFDCWLETWRKARMSQNFCGQKLKQSVFNAWMTCVQKQKSLKQLQTCLVQQREAQCLSNSLHKWKSELAHSVCLNTVAKNHLAQCQTRIKCGVFRQWHVWCLEQKAERHYNIGVLKRCLSTWQDRFQTSRHQFSLLITFQEHSTRKSVSNAFTLWKQRLIVHNHITSSANKKLLHKVFSGWKFSSERQKQLRQAADTVSRSVNTNRMAYCFQYWRHRYHKHLQREEEVTNMVGRCNFKLTQVMFGIWRDSARESVAISVHIKNVMKSSFVIWREAISQRHLDCSLGELADSHLENKICLLVLRAWRDEVLVSKMAAKRLKRIVHQCAKRWQSITRHKKLANDLYQHKLLNHMWTVWTTQTIKQQVSRNIQTHLNKTAMAEVFRAWHHLTVIKKTGQKQLDKVNLQLKMESFKQWKSQC